jgi:hypothetical protein
MTIAVVAWCSMIAAPGMLNLAPPKRWHRDGPWLAVEYARLSRGGLLELALVDDDTAWEAARHPHPTCWAPHAADDLTTARDNLRVRTRVQPAQIGAWQVGERPTTDAGQIIAAWCEEKRLHGAVWCAAPAKVPPLTADAAVAYVQEMHPTDLALARAYVQRTPAQIQTPFRARFREAFGWQDEVLPAEMFAD